MFFERPFYPNWQQLPARSKANPKLYTKELRVSMKEKSPSLKNTQASSERLNSRHHFYTSRYQPTIMSSTSIPHDIPFLSYSIIHEKFLDVALLKFIHKTCLVMNWHDNLLLSAVGQSSLPFLWLLNRILVFLSWPISRHSQQVTFWLNEEFK